VLGYGLDSFRQYSVTFFPLANPADIGPGAHNVYVQLFFELGVLGLIAFFWLFGRLASWLRSLATTDRLGSVIASGLTLAYLVASVSDNMFSYLSFNWYFWFLQGAACALALAKIPDPSGASAVQSATIAGTDGSRPAGTAVS
jgi:O-antigen ligase